MSGYTPVFGSLFRGSLCGQWPALPVFCTLLPLADKDGILDYSFGYLAGVTGWPEALLREGIAQLEAPDPSSRNPTEDGRRIVRLRENTEWGWRIVNHAAYREKARLMAQNAAQVADGRNAEKVRRYKEKKAGHPQTPADTLSNTNPNPYAGQLRSDSVGDLSPSYSDRGNSERLKANPEGQKALRSRMAGVIRPITHG